MRTEFGSLGTAQELMLYEILKELRKLNTPKEKPKQETPPVKKPVTRSKVKKEGI